MGDTWAVRAARLFDGHRLHEGATVLVEDGVVVDVGPGILGEFPVVELDDDVTLLPGLVDTHVHLAFDPSHHDDVVGSFEADDEVLLARIHDNAAKQLAAGVTTVRDLGDKRFLTTQLDSPLTVLASGPPLTVPQGHCWFLGGEIDGREQMLRAVEERAARGCEVVKVMVSGGNITPGNSPFEPQIRNPLLKEIVDEAHRLGMHTAGHVHAPASVLDALDAGFDTLEHVSFATPEGAGHTDVLLQRLLASGVVVSATAGALPGARPPPTIASRLEKVVEGWGWMMQQGMHVTVGSDAGIGPGKPHGVAPHSLRQLSAFVTPVEVLRALTSRGAEGIGLGGRKGVLARGADADLLAVNGDPTTDPAALLDVAGVWVRGEPVRR